MPRAVSWLKAMVEKKEMLIRRIERRVVRRIALRGMARPGWICGGFEESAFASFGEVEEGNYLRKESGERDAAITGEGEELAGGGGHVGDGAELGEDYEDRCHGRRTPWGCVVENLCS